MIPGALAITLLGCRSAVEPEDGGACRQTYEFGNTGCVEITGHVVGLRDQPIVGIMVGPRYRDGDPTFTTSYVRTDAEAAFAFRVVRDRRDPGARHSPPAAGRALGEPPRSENAGGARVGSEWGQSPAPPAPHALA